MKKYIMTIIIFLFLVQQSAFATANCSTLFQYYIHNQTNIEKQLPNSSFLNKIIVYPIKTKSFKNTATYNTCHEKIYKKNLPNITINDFSTIDKLLLFINTVIIILILAFPIVILIIIVKKTQTLIKKSLILHILLRLFIYFFFFFSYYPWLNLVGLIN